MRLIPSPEGVWTPVVEWPLVLCDLPGHSSNRARSFPHTAFRLPSSVSFVALGNGRTASGLDPRPSNDDRAAVRLVSLYSRWLS